MHTHIWLTKPLQKWILTTQNLEMAGTPFSHATFLLVFFFLAVLEFELRASHLLGRHSATWATLQALFSVGYFWDRVLRTICPGWLRTLILLISASWVARITDRYETLAGPLLHFLRSKCKVYMPILISLFSIFSYFPDSYVPLLQ
jgi:hypothetical protein